MRRTIFILAITLSTTAAVAHAFTDEEHRHLALRAFEHIAFMEVTITPETLAEICVRSSRDDMSPARFHVRGKTVYEQADAITLEQLNEIVAAVLDNPPTENVFGPYANNVVANYLVYHSIALGCAQKAHSEWADADPPPRIKPHSEWLEHALVFEAVALGYLADAFSSSHMLTPAHLPLTSFQDANVRAAHEFFATQGAYVLAGGEVWQAFGDGLLQWYGPAYERVVDAGLQSVADLSLRSSLLSSAALDSARVHDRVAKIPTVIVAVWQRGVSYPQFREEGLHDPDLHADHRFLYSRAAFPPPYSWTVENLNRHVNYLEPDDPHFVSVEYHQTLDFPPAFAGLLLMAGGGALVSDDGGGGVGSVAAGYAWDFAMPLVSRVRTSLELEYLYRLGDPDRRVIVPRYGLGLGSPVVPGIEAVHFEVGYAWGLHAPYKDQGVKWGVGIGTKPVRFPFTYAGVSARIKYERFWMDDVLDGFQLQLIFR